MNYVLIMIPIHVAIMTNVMFSLVVIVHFFPLVREIYNDLGCVENPSNREQKCIR